jgi:CheY-like chemotaxis protein
MKALRPFIILYVEDDPAHAEFTRMSFERKLEGYHLMHLSDGQQALDYLFCKGKYRDMKDRPNPDLILLDLRLPVVDGLEVLKRIKDDNVLCCIPIVILSTSGSESDKERAYRLHVNSYLVKPLDASRFTRMIESFGNYWMEWNSHAEC